MTEEQPTTSQSPTSESELTASFDPELELDNFDSLLQHVQQFRVASKNLSREALFENAERLAEQFAELMREED